MSLLEMMSSAGKDLLDPFAPKFGIIEFVKTIYQSFLTISSNKACCDPRSLSVGEYCYGYIYRIPAEGPDDYCLEFNLQVSSMLTCLSAKFLEANS